jgi:hypothetical protein
MVITASTGFSDEDTGGDAVQVNLDAVRLPEAPVPDAVGWIEAIVARVRNVRDAGVSRPVVAAERMGA